MDLIDKKIICELEQNCRTPISKIAKKLRINRNVVTYRINNLKKEGIIRKYICSINLGKLGYQTYKIYFKTQNIQEESKLINFLKENKKIIHLIKLEGEYNLSCVVVTKNIVELDNFLVEVKSNFKNLIKEYFISIIVYSKIFKLEKLILNKHIKQLKLEKYSSNENEVKIDEADKKILHELSQDADLSVIELAKKTKLTSDVIKHRMKKLKENLISSFRIVLDLNKLGYFHYVVLLQSNNLTRSDEQRLITWATMKKDIIYCTKRIGNFDFEINIAIKDINNLNKFIRELKIEFGDIINSYSTILNSEILKLNYVPF